MASIRDLVAALRQREGVEAAIVLGRDGLLIDSQVVPGLNPEDLAARIPPIITPSDDGFHTTPEAFAFLTIHAMPECRLSDFSGIECDQKYRFFHSPHHTF